jgi:predicted permease
MTTRPGFALRAAQAAVRFASVVVPATRRHDWRRQWDADLFHQWAFLEAHPRRGRTLDLLSRAGGAVPHALSLRFRSWNMPTLFNDLRHGARNLAARPGFTGVAILLLGLGIGANATVYAWVENFLLRPLPGVSRTADLVALHGTTRTRRDISVSNPNFADLAARRPESLSHLAAHRLIAVNVRAEAEPERAWAEIVTGDYFALLGVQPQHGRVLSSDDDRVPGGHPVAVISHRYWTRRFGARRAVIGSDIRINGAAFTVVGVAAERFRGGFPAVSTDLWVPMMMQRAVYPGDRLTARGDAWLSALARLAPGASIDQARAGLSAVAAQLATEHPDVNTNRGIAVYTLATDPSTAAGILGPMFAVLAAVGGVVLLTVCANLASLLLVRGAARQREIAVRLALGASRLRIVRQLLAENVLLAAGGAAAGVVFALWASGLFRLFVPPTPQPIDADVILSLRLVLYSLGLALATTVVFGLVPALQISRPSLVPALKESRGAIGGRRRTWVRNALVVTQVALSALLLAGAGLFARTLANAQRFDVGFDMEHGLLASIDLAPAGYDEPRGLALFDTLLQRIGAIPGVEAAALARDVPLKLGGGSDTSVEIEGYVPSEGEEITIYYDRVSPDIFRALGVPLIAGRGFTPRDAAASERVIVINETMARRYWKDGDAIGRRVDFGGPATVVGVVGDLTYTSPGAAPVAYMYLPLAAYYRPDMTLVVRTTGDPAGVATPIRAALQSIDANLPLFDVSTMAERRGIVLFVPRLVATLLGVLGAAALVLAAVGLYGLLAFVVGQRTQEIGVRLALGAQPSELRRLIVRQGVRLAAIGVAGGLGLACVVLPLASSQLIGVGARDLTSYGGAALLLVGGAIAASYLPARRAAAIDPIEALRVD